MASNTLFKTIFGDESSRFIKAAASVLKKINALEAEVSLLSDEAFPQKTTELKARLQKGDTLDDILPEAFALVREASKRTLKLRHYDVQLIGGMALHSGKIAEMRTGEGKTLVATLPIYLNALAGRGVHLVTANDYLSRRDAGWMGEVYAFLGLSTAVINSQNVSFIYDKAYKLDETEEETAAFKIVYDSLRPCNRKEAYNADITYGTNHEFGFDYLRDNLANSMNGVVQRGHAYAIVDEIDSILIDEARTPLIISSEAGDSEDLYVQFSDLAKKLKQGDDYEVDEKLKAITLTDEGITRAEKLLGIDNIYTEKSIKYVHHLETAVRAEALFAKDKDYVTQDGEIIIVDAFTGRMMHGRRFNEGLHQALEAKEGVKIQKETRAVASITFQNYFKFYEKISGMTGTAETSAEEFLTVYNLSVIAIPTHLSIQRVDHNDLIFQTEKGKFKAVAKKIKEMQEQGQPVLVGTVSIEKNELLSAYLLQEGVKHTVLNAKNHEKEGEIIAQAGRKGAVTIATNMAGRGIDIKLGGSPGTKEEYDEVRSLGGLFVLGTERHEARRIDNQLRGRAGRQGDPGATQFFVSLEDDLMRVFGSDNIKKMMGRFGIPEEQPIENSFITRTLESAQGKIEGFHFDARKHTLEYDNVLNHQRKAIYSRRRKLLENDQEELEVLLGEELDALEDDKKELFEQKRKDLGNQAFFDALRQISLHVIDVLWVEHLETMEYMRSSVNLRAYGQRDPLVEYKKEGLRLFRELEMNFKSEILTIMETLQAPVAGDAPTGPTLLVTSHDEPASFVDMPKQKLILSTDPEGQNTPKQEDPESTVGRNDPCPCGSGKKYKKCHGA